MKEIDMNEMMGAMPKEKFLIGDADHLFKDGEKSRDIRIIHSSSNDEKASDSVMIILNNSLCLWFFKKEGAWKYDGWEMGDYANAWSESAI